MKFQRKYNPAELAGKMFGHLTIRSILGNYRCSCDCSCGKSDLVKRYHCLINGNTTSCGCEKIRILHESSTTHGETRVGVKFPPEYHSWANMNARCNNENRPDFEHYGGRGISVCDEWKNSYQEFLAYVGRRPSPGHSIDRFPNHNGNYEPGNVRWATKAEQARNRRSSHFLTAFGKTLTISEWSEVTGICRTTIGKKIRKGMSPEEVLHAGV